MSVCVCVCFCSPGREAIFLPMKGGQIWGIQELTQRQEEAESRFRELRSYCSHGNLRGTRFPPNPWLFNQPPPPVTGNPPQK